MREESSQDTLMEKFIETSDPLTVVPTAEQLSLPEVSRASPSVRPGSEGARRMTVGSGLKCSGLYVKSGPLGSLVRMLLESSAWNSTVVYLTWRVKATPRNRLLFQLAPWTHDTDETECGLLPTTRSQDGKHGQATDYKDLLHVRVARLWATPTDQD